jgi:hypothetical protein
LIIGELHAGDPGGEPAFCLGASAIGAEAMRVAPDQAWLAHCENGLQPHFAALLRNPSSQH